MSTFNITIDATNLSYSGYLVASPTLGNVLPPTGTAKGWVGWTLNDQAYTVALSPGPYQFQYESGELEFVFTVTPTGLIEYASEYAPFLTGVGTSELKILGYKVTIDARYITSQVAFSSNMTTLPYIGNGTFSFVPGSYILQVEAVCLWSFSIDTNGKFQYDQSFDYPMSGGFLEGMGTSALTLLGYPLLIDARNAGGAGVILSPYVPGVPFATSDVTYVNVLPMPSYNLQFENGVPSNASFTMDLTGNVTLETSLPYILSKDKYHGITRITVNRLTLEHSAHAETNLPGLRSH